MRLFLKKINVMANSVDPDPSGAVWSVSGLFAYAIFSDNLVYEILGHLPLLYARNKQKYDRKDDKSI